LVSDVELKSLGDLKILDRLEARRSCEHFVAAPRELDRCSAADAAGGTGNEDTTHRRFLSRLEMWMPTGLTPLR
jgi:hypothetical protein